MSEEIVKDEVVDEPKAVDPKVYEQTKNDMHKFKRSFMEVQKANEELSNRLKELEEKGLQDSNNYKELWEKERKTKSDLEDKLKKFTGSVLESKKMDAIKQEVLKRGLDEEFLDVIDAFDTSEVLVETTSSGQFIVNGADTWAEALKSTKPKMFKQKADPTFNNKSGSFDGREKTYTPQEVLKMQKENPEKYREVITTKRHLIKA